MLILPIHDLIMLRYLYSKYSIDLAVIYWPNDGYIDAIRYIHVFSDMFVACILTSCNTIFCIYYSQQAHF